LVIERAGSICPLPLSGSACVRGSGAGAVTRAGALLLPGRVVGHSVGLPGGEREPGAGVLEVDQLPACLGRIPAFTLANEAAPGSAGCVNTGFVCAA